MSTYTIGDIHGRYDVLTSLVNKLNLTSDDHVIFLGDYIDRGPDWFKVIKYINDLKNICNITTLLGNHELMMIKVLEKLYNNNNANNEIEDDTRYDIIHNWFCNGGDITFTSYTTLNAKDKQFAIDFMNNLPLDISIDINNKSYVLCHALPEDVGMTKFDSVWGRAIFNDDDTITYQTDININTLMNKYANKIIIHGHSPVMLYIKPNDPITPISYQVNDVIFIDIDLGCGSIGKIPKTNLCALRLDDEQEFYAFD